MSKFWKDPQQVIALGVTLISVCALIVSITQTRIMIRQSELMDIQARASVRPILLIGSHQAFDPESGKLVEYRIVLTNSGVGPATVDDVYVEYEGKAIRSWGHLFSTVNLPDSIPSYIDNTRLSKSVVQAGQQITVLDLSNNLALARAVYHPISQIKMKILYSSIYGDQFEGRNTDEGWVNVAVSEKKASLGGESFAD